MLMNRLYCYFDLQTLPIDEEDLKAPVAKSPETKNWCVNGSWPLSVFQQFMELFFYAENAAHWTATWIQWMLRQ